MDGYANGRQAARRYVAETVGEGALRAATEAGDRLAARIDRRRVTRAAAERGEGVGNNLSFDWLNCQDSPIVRRFNLRWLVAKLETGRYNDLRVAS